MPHVCRITISTAHQRLHHEHTLSPELSDEIMDGQILPLLHPLQHDVQYHKAPSPAHTSTAVHQQGRGVRDRMLPSHYLDEVQQREGVDGYTVVRPDSVVELGDLELAAITAGGLWGWLLV